MKTCIKRVKQAIDNGDDRCFGVVRASKGKKDSRPPSEYWIDKCVELKVPFYEMNATSTTKESLLP